MILVIIIQLLLTSITAYLNILWTHKVPLPLVTL